MPKPRIKVSTKQAVDLIRSGASDALIMETFGLSAVGLRKLFQKLLDANEIQAPELDCRELSWSQSDTVNLTRVLMDVRQPGTVNIDSAVREINAGMSDFALMEKYRLSVCGLDNMFQKLVAAGEIRKTKIQERRSLAQQTGIDFPEPVWVDYSPSENERRGATDTGTQVSGFLRRRQVLVAAVAGGITGMAVLVVGYLMVVGSDGVFAALRSSPKGRVAEEAPRNDTDKRAQEAATILESIAGDRHNASKAQGDGTSYLQECLKNCKTIHSGNDDTSRLDLSHCQKECLDTHSQLFKKMRQKYHGRPE